MLVSILIALTSLIYFFLAYAGFLEQNIDLSNYAQYEGVITARGIDIRHGSSNEAKVFFLTMRELKEKLGIYRMSKKYDDLLEKINVGDRVKVYYRPGTDKRENINIKLIQVEKNGEIAVVRKNLKKKKVYCFILD